jgi:predicted phosphodiesterase
MRIQFMSDLHLEFLEHHIKITPVGDILILAGDVVTGDDPEDMPKFEKFLAQYCSHFIKVIHVPGNHEFWCLKSSKPNNIKIINDKFKMLQKKFKNYFYIPRGIMDILFKGKNYRFICATLWAAIPVTEYDAMQKVMKDYDRIWLPTKEGSRKAVPADTVKIHREHVKFIKKSIETTPPQCRIILVTHHKPTIDLGQGSAYETDLTQDIIKKPVFLAIHGHTHVLYDKKINGVRVVSNPRGYPRSERTGFRKDWFIEA